MAVTNMDTKNYEHYPFANAFPMMNDREPLDDHNLLRFLMCDGVPS